LRRQQCAIRQTSSLMERSASVLSEKSASKKMGSYLGGCSQDSSVDEGATVPSSGAGENGSFDPRLHKRHPQPNIVSREESDAGYESGGSRGSSRSGWDSSSVSSGGVGMHRRSKSVVSKTPKQKRSPSPAMQPVVIANFQPVIEALEPLDLNSSNLFEPLLSSDPMALEMEMTVAEREVVELLKKEQAVVKTIRNSDWSAFLQKFKPAEGDGVGKREHHPAERKKNKYRPPSPTMSVVDYPFNSFVTSTSLLPSCAKKMRCFGSTTEYAIGVVFALPTAFPNDASEDDSAKRTLTWSWPSGYSAKTEFNINDYGNLINGREEALVSLSGLRKMNHSYLYDEDYIVGGRMVKGGLTTIPYNEVYVRVGGLGRISGGVDVSSGKACCDADGSGRSFDLGKITTRYAVEPLKLPINPLTNLIIALLKIKKVLGFPWHFLSVRQTSVIWCASSELARDILPSLASMQPMTSPCFSLLLSLVCGYSRKSYSVRCSR
jgi:hypothetical protein